MSYSSSGFLNHYIKLMLEGNDPEIFLNLCMRKGITVKNVAYRSDKVLVFEVLGKDYDKVAELAGNRYKIRIKGHRGLWYILRRRCSNKALLAGAILFAGMVYWQSLFVAEISINGYESLNEPAIRKTLAEAGLVEGCRKDIDLNSVKLHLYEEYDRIAWAGIQYDGNLAYVTIAEGGQPYRAEEVADDVPCNIVADRDGYIDSIDPEEGLRAVEDGAFVRAGDILISGTIPLQSTAYGTEAENITETYVHAGGTVKARIPVRLNYYRTSHDTVRKGTGEKIWSVAVNDHDPVQYLIPFRASSKTYKTLINTAWPFRLKLQLVCTEKVKLGKREITEKEAREQILNEIHEYVEENLPEDTEILNKSLNFVREKNIITIGVTLETLQKIGIEEEIIIDKSNRKSEKDDDR